MHPNRRQVMVRFGYDGSRFHGLQPQKELATAGGALRKRLEEAFGQRARGLCFSARTDAGVHCLRNVCTSWFIGLTPAQLREVERPRNDGLTDVRARHVPANVHARGASSEKTYRYIVDAESSLEHMDSRFVWGIGPAFDVAKMQREAQALLGTHDFTAFRSSQCSAPSPIKTISHAWVDGPYEHAEGNRAFIVIRGDGFLRSMVRFIAGTLVEVGTGWRPEGSIQRALNEKSREFSGMRAPARGLTLMRVHMNSDADLHFLRSPPLPSEALLLR